VSDGTKNHTAGGGDSQEQGTGAAQATAGSVRLRAEELIERGLRLYAQGDLIGAVAEWRRALEIDRSNRRARDYVSYVDDHFEVLSEKFRLAREQREAELEPLVEPPGLAIEIEADDPMEDMSPYESIELEGSPGRAPSANEEDDGDSTSPAPGAPHVGGDAAGGKVGVGRRAWARRALARELDERWPMEESWPSASRSNDTLEMDVDPSVLDDLDDLVAAVADGAEAAHAADDEGDDDDAPVDQPPDDEGPDGDEGVSVEEPLDNYEPPGGQTIDDVLDAVEEEDTGPGESTQPSRPSLDRFAQRGLPTAEGSGRLDASRLAQAQRFAAALAEPDPLESEGEDWADGTPPIETVERPGGDIERSGVSHLREDELREVRVTFRRSPRTTAPPIAAETAPAEAATDPAADRNDDHDDVDAADRVEASDIVGELDADREDDRDMADGDVADGDMADLVDRAGDRADSEHDADDDQSDEIRARAARDSSSGDDDDDRDDRHEDDVEEEELTIERGGGVSSRVSQIRRRRTTPTTALPRRTTTPVPLRRTTTPVAAMRRTTAPVPPWASDGDRATTELTGRKRPMAHTAISIDLVSTDLLAELATAMHGASTRADEQLRDRVGWLIDRARRENREGRFPTAVVAVDLALDENPESAVVQKLIHSNRELFFEIYANYLGDLRAVPGLALPMSDIPVNELDHRAAFLLSRVDGVLSLEDVLDVAGMARLEAFRHLSRLMLRGILEIRP
jgi:hypothetical protein